MMSKQYQIDLFVFTLCIIFGAAVFWGPPPPAESSINARPQPVPAAYPAALDTVHNDFMANYYPIITASQDAYYNNEGKYFQGLLTHSTVPDAGSITGADRLSIKPTDQGLNWLDFGLTSFNCACNMSINVTDGESGKGYTIILFSMSGGVLYSEQIGVGAHTNTVGWR